MRLLFVTAAPIFFLLSACAGKVDYVRPSSIAAPGSNVKTIDRPRDAVWNATVPELGKQYFMINNLDKSSGLINVSYSGDPERYVDCGRISSYVKNARGERTYDFPGAKAQQTYELMNSNGLFFIDRHMNLEGRMNLVFEEINANSTRVTANTRYVVSRTSNIRGAANNSSNVVSDSVSFNSAGRASFPPSSNGQSAECAATGDLEREVLSSVK